MVGKSFLATAVASRSTATTAAAAPTATAAAAANTAVDVATAAGRSVDGRRARSQTRSVNTDGRRLAGRAAREARAAARPSWAAPTLRPALAALFNYILTACFDSVPAGAALFRPSITTLFRGGSASAVARSLCVSRVHA